MRTEDPAGSIQRVATSEPAAAGPSDTAALQAFGAAFGLRPKAFVIVIQFLREADFPEFVVLEELSALPAPGTAMSEEMCGNLPAL